MIPAYLDEQLSKEENIRQRMLDKTNREADKSEGSYIWDALAPVSMELALVSLLARYVLSMGFGRTANSEYLTMRAEEHGVIRRPAVKAIGKVQFKGTAGTVIPTGLLLSTEGEESSEIYSLEFTTTEDVALDSEGNGEAAVEAIEAGKSGNIPAGKISVVMSNIAGLQSVSNSEETHGGVDIEDDEILRERYLEKVRRPGTSGNIADYQQWAKEIPGVTDVRVLPLWAGNGTVKLVILGADKLPPSSEIVENVQNYIAPSNKGEGKAPTGATVTVVSADALLINIEANILLDNSTVVSVQELTDNFKAALSKYLAGMAFNSDTIRYTRIGAILVEIQGVADYIDLNINGDTNNIPISNTQVAIVRTVTINAQ